MNHLKKIEDRVISILKTNVDARSDDMMLYLLVCNSFYSNENSVGKMPFEVVMKNYKELELPHFESVRRTRRYNIISSLRASTLVLRMEITLSSIFLRWFIAYLLVI